MYIEFERKSFTIRVSASQPMKPDDRKPSALVSIRAILASQANIVLQQSDSVCGTDSLEGGLQGWEHLLRG